MEYYCKYLLLDAMTSDATMSYRHLGGSLPLNDSTYVTRQADDDLYGALANGEFCYVLTSRQMGKSSLRVRVMQQLQAEGKACGVVDLSAIGTDVSVEAWYKGIAYRILRNFRQVKGRIWKQWWQEHEFLSPVQQLSECLDEILLETITEDIVIFIDEIDTVLSCGFNTDDLFSWIRACYNRRVDDPKYRRLTFCLIGVATPSDLISDKQRTPFNIGRAIELYGFEYEQARHSLLPGLMPVVEQPEAVLKDILTWTGGQPFLTQKVGQLVVSHAQNFVSDIEALISEYIIQNWESQDEPEHLKTIRDRIFSNPDKTSRILGFYRQILRQGKLCLNESSDLRELQLTGLVVKENNALVVFNPIYQTIFNLLWVENALASLRPYALAFQAWVDLGEPSTSNLLQGDDLVQAKAWAAGKSLSDQDYTFLAACQEDAQKSVEEDLEITAQAKQLLEVANAKANRRIRLGVGILGLASVILAMTIAWSGQMVNYAQIDAAKAREKADQDRLESELAQQEAQDRVQSLEEESDLIQKNLQEAKLAKQKADQDFKALQKNLRQAQLDIQSAQTQLQETNRQAEISAQQNQELEASAKNLRQENERVQKEVQQAKLAAKVAQSEAKRAADAEVLAIQSLQDTQLQAERSQYLNFSFQNEPWLRAFQTKYSAARDNQEGWVSEPKAIALRLLGYPNSDGCEPGEITVRGGIEENQSIVIIRSPESPKEICLDDSVKDSEHRIELVKDQSAWEVEWIGGRFRCRPGAYNRYPDVYVPKRCK